MGLRYWDSRVSFSVLVGKTLTAVHEDHDSIKFVCDDGSEYLQYHEQDCCESVTVDDVNGDWDDLIGTPILVAEERDNIDPPEKPSNSLYRDDSETWTFYCIRTIKGSVDIRWYGSSNGYYSESVDFVETKKADRKKNMDFSEALKIVKSGGRVARSGWNGKKMFIFLVPGSTFQVNREPLISILGEGTTVNYHGHVDMRTADGTIVPWLCSQTDLLAEDWEQI